MKRISFDTDTFREIGDSLLRNRSRSLLTGFGIFWGLFMLLFLVGGGNGLKEMLMQNFSGFASNTVLLIGNSTALPYKGLPEGRSWSPDIKDIERLKTMVPELDKVSGLVSNWGLNAEYEGNVSSVTLKGVAAEYGEIESPKLKYGRYLSEADVKQMRKNCVIGKRVYNELFPEGGDPCGKYIQIGSIAFRVVGVDYATGNMSINGPASQSAMIPVSVAQQIYGCGDEVNAIVLTGKPGVKMSSIEGRLRSIMARQHQYDERDQSALLYLNTEQIFSIMDNLFRGINFLIWLVGIGTLLAGAIGVSNIMMVTVRERTTEIGIRRAIGATPGVILSQIMLESVTLTAVSGTLAIVFSVLMLNLMEIITKHQAAFQITFGTAVIAALMLLVVGVLAGLAPALRAMRIKPVDAMRDE